MVPTVRAPGSPSPSAGGEVGFAGGGVAPAWEDLEGMGWELEEAVEWAEDFRAGCSGLDAFFAGRFSEGFFSFVLAIKNKCPPAQAGRRNKLTTIGVVSPLVKGETARNDDTKGNSSRGIQGFFWFPLVRLISRGGEGSWIGKWQGEGWEAEVTWRIQRSAFRGSR